VIDAFAQLGIEARPLAGAPDRGVDLVVDPDGIGAEIQVKHRSLVSDDEVERLLSDGPHPGTFLLVVADRVTDSARKRPAARRYGYLDLRGRLALRTDQLVIDAEVEPVVERVERARALSGKVGLEVATALLLQPERSVAVRELARELGRSPSTVSEVLAALRREELVDTNHAVTDSRLFWQVADRWSTSRTPIAKLPVLSDAGSTEALRLGLDDVDKPGWALTDSVAAAAYGWRSGRVRCSTSTSPTSPLSGVPPLCSELRRPSRRHEPRSGWRRCPPSFTDGSTSTRTGSSGR
jgi:DNA-binding transcriptional ArsR family regulator